MRPIHPCRDDDDLRTQLRAHITAIMPAELILPRGRLSAVTHKLLRASLRSPRINELVPGKGGFWGAEQTFEEICAARCSGSTGWPPLDVSGRACISGPVCGQAVCVRCGSQCAGNSLHQSSQGRRAPPRVYQLQRCPTRSDSSLAQ